MLSALLPMDADVGAIDTDDDVLGLQTGHGRSKHDAGLGVIEPHG